MQAGDSHGPCFRRLWPSHRHHRSGTRPARRAACTCNGGRASDEHAHGGSTDESHDAAPARTAVRDGPGDKTSARAGGQQRADSSARTADSERALWLVRRRRDERRTRPKAMESWQPRVGRPVAVPTRGGRGHAALASGDASHVARSGALVSCCPTPASLDAALLQAGPPPKSCACSWRCPLIARMPVRRPLPHLTTVSRCLHNTYPSLLSSLFASSSVASLHRHRPLLRPPPPHLPLLPLIILAFRSLLPQPLCSLPIRQHRQQQRLPPLPPYLALAHSLPLLQSHRPLALLHCTRPPSRHRRAFVLM